MINLSILVLLLPLAMATSEKLISIQVIFRHGARYPYDLIKNDKLSEEAAKNNMLRQLTEVGKHQLYLLGKGLHRKYWKKMFEGSKQQHQFDSSLIDAFSTNSNRTIESAKSLRKGLLEALQPQTVPHNMLNSSLPPFPGAQTFHGSKGKDKFYVYGQKGKYYHDVSVKTEPNLQKLNVTQQFKQVEDNLKNDYLVKILRWNCPKSKQIINQNLHSKTAERIKKYPLVQEYYRKLKQELGYKVNLNLHGSVVGESYEVNSHLMSPTLKLFQDPEMRRTNQFLRYAYQILEDTYTPLQLKIGSTWLLQKIILNMKMALSNKGPRINIMSTHDWTMVLILNVLKMVTLECLQHSFVTNTTSDTCIHEYTAFASNIVFELWEKENHQYIVKIAYNGMQKKIPICGNKDHCQLEEFETWAQGMYVEPNKQCHVPKISFKFNDTILSKK